MSPKKQMTAKAQSRPTEVSCADSVAPAGNYGGDTVVASPAEKCASVSVNLPFSYSLEGQEAQNAAVAFAADASLGGYLRQASGRQRVVIAQEGGRGTKRRAHLVTSESHRVLVGGELSGAIKRAAEEAGENGGDDDDRCKMRATTSISDPLDSSTNFGNSEQSRKHPRDDGGNTIAAAVGTPQPQVGLKVISALLQGSSDEDEEDEGWEDVGLDFVDTYLKYPEDCKEEVSSGGLPPKSAREEASSGIGCGGSVPKAEFGESKSGIDVTFVKMEFEQRPHADSSVREWVARGSRRDDDLDDNDGTGFAAAAAERERQLAKRRSLRNQNLASVVCKVLVHVARGRWLHHEAHRPQLAKLLLEPLVAASSFASQPAPGASARQTIPDILSAAVNVAATFAAASKEQEGAKPDLRPVWVTPTRDTCNNTTSAACKALLDAINSVFHLITEVDESPPPFLSSKHDGLSATAEAAISSDATTASAPRKRVITHFLATEILPRYALTHRLVRLRNRRLVAPPEALPGPLPVGVDAAPIDLESPAYFAAVLLALAHQCGLRGRLTTAFTSQDILHLGVARAESTGEQGDQDDGVQVLGVFGPVGRGETWTAAEDVRTIQGGRVTVPKQINTAPPTPAAETPPPSAASGKVRGSSKKRPREGPSSSSAARAASTAATLPKSWVWCEVFCPIRQAYIAVNPCASCVTQWNAPYVVAFGGDHAIDVTPRYVSRFSEVYRQRSESMRHGVTKDFLQRLNLTGGGLMKSHQGAQRRRRRCRNPSKLEEGDAGVGRGCRTAIRDSAASGDGAAGGERDEEEDGGDGAELFAGPMSHTERLLGVLNRDWTEQTRSQLPRERMQLEKLLYGEPVPATLKALKGHPLYVVETDLGSFDAVFPRDGPHLVGNIKGANVYKRAAVTRLKTAEAWLRYSRSLACGADGAPPAPYKELKPPPSRPFAKPTPLFGLWQTTPFEPLPIRPDGTIPKYESTRWYLLLRKGGAKVENLVVETDDVDAERKYALAAASPDSLPPLPHGLTRITGCKGIHRIATRMGVDFGFCVTGFIKRTFNLSVRGAMVPRTRWEPVLEGVVVKTVQAAKLRGAFDEWVTVQRAQEAARRKERALRWWEALIRRAFAQSRLEQQFQAS